MKVQLYSVWQRFGQATKTHKNGVEYRLMCEPYLTHNAKFGGAHYVAEAISLDSLDEMIREDWLDRYGMPLGAEALKIVWQIVNPEAEQDEDACDWGDFTVYDRAGKEVDYTCNQSK